MDTKFKLTSFLDKYNTIIFDMDGVITSEENYWNCAELTVKHYINGGSDPEYCKKNLKEIRAFVFMDDKLIRTLKDKGVNSNWDLGYVVYLLYKINGGDFDKIYEFTSSFSNILDVYDAIAEQAAAADGADADDYKRNGRLWHDMRYTFQEWFLGDDMFFKVFGKEPEIRGKTGLLNNEMPIISMKKLKTFFYLMNESGKNICTGTGRPYNEIYPPMKNWGLYGLFKKDGFINYDDVIRAEENLKKDGITATLTKPHPFMFLKAFFGDAYSDRDIYTGNYPSGNIKNALVVGDAGADILAAKAGGFDFAAVLTGIAGRSARGYFEDMRADYILDSLEDFIEREDKDEYNSAS